MAKPTISPNPLLEVLNPITKYLKSDNKGNTDIALSNRASTMDAVNKLLKSLLDQQAVDTITRQTRNQGSTSIGIADVGTAGQGNNAVYPSFNIRTPVVTISLNETQIYPSKPNLDTGLEDENSQQKVNFQNLSLSFPLGGVETSITGSLQLFTKDPKEILIPLDMFAKNATQNKAATNAKTLASGGLPIVRLTFGWAFSDSKAPDTISKAISPELEFVVTNMTMSDPGTVGTTFNLTLHETGSLLLEHSSDDIIILSNYPQEQLRTLLEGLLHTRLFTLDDLLYFNTKNPYGIGLAPTPGGSSNSAAISEPLSPNPNIPVVSSLYNPAPPQQGSPFSSASSIADSNTNLNTYLLTGQLPTNTPPGAALGGSAFDYGVLNGSGLGPKTVKPASSVPTASSSSTAPVNTNATKTFFSTQPSAAIGINGRNFLTVAKELAAQCRCKWYPHDNTKDDIDADKKVTQESTARLSDLARDLRLIQNIPSGTIPTDLANQISNHLNDTTNAAGTVMNSATATAEINNKVQNLMARLATRCQLFWVPNIPPEWETLGSVEYATGLSEDGTPQAYEKGAFFLLPDVLDDFSIFMADLPVQYGPGASALPYFYGSGQNVFQAAKGGTPEMFGEVISLAVNHSSLVTILANAANEKTAYAVNGKYMTQLEAATNYTADGSSRSTAESRLNSSTTPAEEVKIAAARALQNKLIGVIRSRFNESCGTGKDGTLLVTDMNELIGNNRSISGGDIAVTNKSGEAQTATYMTNSRVASFLRYPTAAKIAILGDPNLIRLGPGCFELLSYYPVQHDDYTVTQELNSLTSGIYFVNSIEHTISTDNFLTTLNGAKLVDPINVPNSITNKMLTELKTKPLDLTTNPFAANDSVGLNQIQQGQNNINQVSVIDLNSDTFTDGVFADDLRNIFNTYANITTANTTVQPELLSAIEVRNTTDIIPPQPTTP